MSHQEKTTPDITQRHAIVDSCLPSISRRSNSTFVLKNELQRICTLLGQNLSFGIDILSRYFVLWLRDYEKLYSDWESKVAVDHQRSSRLPSVAVIRSFNDAKDFFFRPHARLELNITRELRGNILNAVLPPHPDQFRRIHDQVHDELQQSLHRFLPWARRNIGRKYVIAAIVLGLVWVSISFLPFVLGYIFDISPLLRLVGFVPLLFGFFALESARMSVSGAIYFCL